MQILSSALLATVGYAQYSVTMTDDENAVTMAMYPEEMGTEMMSTENTGWFKLNVYEGTVTDYEDNGDVIGSKDIYTYKLDFGFKNWATEGMTTFTSKRTTSQWTGWAGQIGFHGETMMD
jgi:hypothetical protein